MSDAPVPLSSMFFSDADAAGGALRSVGAKLLDDLDFEVEVRGAGRVLRRFGVLDNLLSPSFAPTRPLLAQRLLPLLDLAENERLRERMARNHLRFTPVNKRTARRLVPDLHALGLHLPLAWRPMNFDFGARLEARVDKHPLGFLVFYNQGIDVDEAREEVLLRRVFSLPVKGSAHGTFQEPIYDDMLDPDVGLLLEANVRLG